MRRHFWRISAVILVTWGVVGCGGAKESSPSPTQGSAATSAAPAATPEKVAGGNEPAPAKTQPESQPETKPEVKPGNEAAVAATPSEKVPTSSAPAPSVPAEVAAADIPLSTANENLAVVNLQELPRLNAKSTFEDGPTYVYYTGQGAVASADAYYRAELGQRGWKELPATTPATDQYSDRTYEKNGFHIRVAIGASGNEGEVGINLSHLGNADARRLPIIEGSQLEEGATPINAMHKTTVGIAEVAKTLQQKMIADGWQQCGDLQVDQTDVPHYKSMKFRKNSNRVNLGILIDPKNPAEKTSVFYLVDSAIPFNIPMLDTTKMLRINIQSFEAEFIADGKASDVAAKLAAEGEKLGWKIKEEDRTATETSSTFMVEDRADFGLMFSVAEAENETKVSVSPMDFKKMRAAGELAANQARMAAEEAEAERKREDAAKKEMREEIASAAEAATPDANKIMAEAMKALEGIQGDALKNDPDALAALQAQAKALMNEMNEDEEDEDASDEPSGESPKITEFAEDEGEVSAEDAKLQKSICRISLGDKKYELKYCAAFMSVTFDEPMKVVLFSDKPLDEKKIASMLAQGEDVSVYRVGGGFGANTMELRISESSVNVNCAVGDASLGMSSSNVISTVKYQKGAMRGKVKFEEGTELAGEQLTFEAEVAQPALKLNLEAMNKANDGELSQDSDYDFPFPQQCSSKSKTSSNYAQGGDGVVEAPVEKVVAFYLGALAESDWKLQGEPTEDKEGKSVIRAISDQGELMAVIGNDEGDSDDEETKIVVRIRDVKKAKAEGVYPASGKALVLMVNQADLEVELTLSGKKYSLKAMQAATNPKDAVRVTLAPGKYPVQFKELKSGKTKSETLEVGADSSWILFYDPDFAGSLPLFE